MIAAIDGGSLAIVVLGAVGGGTGVAAVIKAMSDRKLAPKSAANESIDRALRAQDEAIENLRAELAQVRIDSANQIAAMRDEHRRAIENKNAEIARLRERIAHLEEERQP